MNEQEQQEELKKIREFYEAKQVKEESEEEEPESKYNKDKAYIRDQEFITCIKNFVKKGYEYMSPEVLECYYEYFLKLKYKIPISKEEEDWVKYSYRAY